MLVKIKHNDQTFEFDSTKQAIAILLTPKDREAIDKMPQEEQLILSAPYSVMKDKAAETWAWAHQWDGATMIDTNATELRKF
jgi:hypothetical protein